MGQDPAADTTLLRGYDAATGAWLWAAAGDAELRGLAAGEEDSLYAVTISKGKATIARFAGETGQPTRWGDRKEGSVVLEGIKGAGYKYVAWGTTHTEDGKNVPVLAKDATREQARELAKKYAIDSSCPATADPPASRDTLA